MGRILALIGTIALLAACGADDTTDATPTSTSTSSTSSSGAGGAGGAGGGTPSGHCFTDPVELTQQGGAVLAETPHYALLAEVDQARASDLASLLEASWGAMEAYFGAAPLLGDDERLAVELYASFDSWVAGMEADGVNPPGGIAGGYYEPANRTAYLYLQPTRYFTQQLLLHEAAHQFHYLARLSTNVPPAWYIEGVAEHVSRHDWDQGCAQIGVLPLLTQEDGPATALADIYDNGIDLAAIVGGTAPASYPMAWSIVRYFELNHTAAFQSFQDAIELSGDSASSAFNAALGSPAGFETDLATWLSGYQEPMSPVFIEWTHLGPSAVRGEAGGVLSIARVKKAPATFTTSFDRPGEGGVLAAYDDANNFEAVIVRESGQLERFSVVAGAATWLNTGVTIASASSVKLAVLHDDADTSTVTANEQSHTFDHASSSAAGLALNASTIRFYAIAID